MTTLADLERRVRQLESNPGVAAGGSASSAAPKWEPLVYSNSWADVGYGFQTGQVALDRTRVWFRGQVARTGVPAAFEVIATLPYRPQAQLDYAVPTNTGFGWVSIRTDGTVRWRSGGHGWVSLDGLSFDLQ